MIQTYEGLTMMFWGGLLLGILIGGGIVFFFCWPSVAALSDFKKRVPYEGLTKLEKTFDTQDWKNKHK